MPSELFRQKGDKKSLAEQADISHFIIFLSPSPACPCLSVVIFGGRSLVTVPALS